MFCCTDVYICIVREREGGWMIIIDTRQRSAAEQMGEKSLCKCRKTEDFIKIFLSFTSSLQGLTTLQEARSSWINFCFNNQTKKKEKLRKKILWEWKEKKREENSCVNKLIEQYYFFWVYWIICGVYTKSSI